MHTISEMDEEDGDSNSTSRFRRHYNQSNVSQLMQLTARSISLVLNAEHAMTESKLWQEKMESYVHFIEVWFPIFVIFTSVQPFLNAIFLCCCQADRFAASSMTRNAVQAIQTLVGLLRPRLGHPKPP